MKNKWVNATAAVITIGVIVAVALMLNRDSQAAAYRIEDGQLVITCSFGVSVPLSDIRELSLTDTTPEIARKTNGVGVGSVQKGEYKLADGSAARLYVDTTVPLYVRFLYGDTVYYLNAKNADDTRALYDEVQAGLN